MRLHHISGDDVVFLYDHTQPDKPRVGDSYYIREAGSNDALVVQIVALDTFNFPSLGEVLMRQIMEESYGTERVSTYLEPPNAPQVENLGQAAGKIRRRVQGDTWSIWNGWLPSRNVEITRVDDDQLLERCGLLAPKHPLVLGETLDGRPFAIEGRSFEKVNVITSLKGMGKSHLSKVLLLELIKQKMVCVVFDVNREYNRLPPLLREGETVRTAGTIVLSASRNFRVTVESFGRRALIRLFNTYNPQENTQNQFELRVNQAFDQLEQIDLANEQVPPDRRRPRPFFTVSFLRSLFPLPPRTNEAVYRAIMDRLDQIEGLNLFAESPQEGVSFYTEYAFCAQQGGALVIDLAPLSSKFAREVFVGATLDMVESVAGTSPKLPFVFFEEAHLYTAGARIENLVTRARHLGITSTFITNMVTQLDETVLRQVDNLFLLYLPHRDDVRHVAKSATTDEETVSAFAQRIERHHAMVVGQASAQYPLVFKVATPRGSTWLARRASRSPNEPRPSHR